MTESSLKIKVQSMIIIDLSKCTCINYLNPIKVEDRCDFLSCKIVLKLS